MGLWIPITVLAAFLQNLRSTFQKQLQMEMGTAGATFVRFGFGAPFAALYSCALFWLFGYEPPELSLRFFFWVAIGGTAQIAATYLLIHMFSLRNFVVGNAYSRTEPMQTAIFAFVLFGVQFSLGAIAAICIAVVGVILISVADAKINPRALVTGLFSRSALIGLSAGTLFGLAAIGFQTAARDVGSQFIIVQAATTLLVGILFQTVIMLPVLALTNPGFGQQLRKVWKTAVLVGFVGATATFGWFTAFTLQEAALVKIVAQVEMLFSFVSSYFIFKERLRPAEALGCALIVAGIICLILFA